MEKETTSQEELNKFFSGVTDYYFFEKTDGMSPEDYSHYIRKNFRRNKISLIFESYS